MTIPRKSNARRIGPFDRARYRQHHTIERLINRYEPFRRMAARDEKRAAYYQAMWLLATTV